MNFGIGKKSALLSTLYPKIIGKPAIQPDTQIGMVQHRFPEKSGFKRIIHFLFWAGDIAYFRVNYMTCKGNIPESHFGTVDSSDCENMVLTVVD
jgi:hypothetical protein